MANTIVILGASFTGLSIAHILLKQTKKEIKDLKVVLVSPSSDLYWNLASVRAIVPGQIDDVKLFQPIAPGFSHYPAGSFEFIVGSATSISPDSKIVTINTTSGTITKNYSDLVIATGSRSPSAIPWKGSLEGSEKTKEILHEYQGKVKAAKSIVVAGAGPTGVETACELAFEYGKGKQITLITSGPTILPGLPPSVIKYATSQLANLNIKIVTGTKVTSSTTNGPSTEINLSTGSKITTDLYLPTVGIIPNTEFVPKKLLNTNGEVVVDEYLQVKGVKDIWAAGDVVDIQPSQMVYAAAQAKALSKNLDLKIKKQNMVAYKTGGAPMIAITLGRSKATGRNGNSKLPSLIVWFIKGRTLFTEKLPKYINGSEF